ncbi:MAG: hypothetical protein R3C32_07240 [Chloroflexota bacterium]
MACGWSTCSPAGPASVAGVDLGAAVAAVGGDPCARPRGRHGPVGASVSLLVRSPGEAAHRRGRRQRVAAQLPGRQRGRVRASRGHSYLRILSLAGDASAQVQAALGQLLDQDDLAGLLLDVRHASAGELAVTREVLGSFTGGEVGRSSTTRATPRARGRGWAAPRPAAGPAHHGCCGREATDGEAERLAALLDPRAPRSWSDSGRRGTPRS